MSSTQVDSASIRKIFSVAAKSLPEGMDEATFNSVRDHLLNHLKSKATEEKAKAKAAEKKAAKPKRGPTGFIVFSNANRDSVKKTMPDAKMPEVSKKLGQMWSKLTDAKKAEWNAKAKALAPVPTQEQVDAMNAKAAKPKRGPTAFFIFMGEKRDEVKNANPDMSVKEIASKIGEMWRALTPEVQASYKNKSAQDKTI